MTTFDGGGSGYTGGLREQRMLPASEGGGALLTLATPTLTNSLVGYAIWVLDGAGAGQYRRVLRANYQQQPEQIVVDRAFVGLDPATSLLQAAPMRGQVIMYRNHIEDTGLPRRRKGGEGIRLAAAQDGRFRGGVWRRAADRRGAQESDGR